MHVVFNRHLNDIEKDFMIIMGVLLVFMEISLGVSTCYVLGYIGEMLSDGWKPIEHH